MDYSQNFAFKEKRQVQSAHFSEWQLTLHNTAMQAPKKKMMRKNVYHLSDEIDHDSVMNFCIIIDIFKNYS